MGNSNIHSTELPFPLSAQTLPPLTYHYRLKYPLNGTSPPTTGSNPLLPSHYRLKYPLNAICSGIAAQHLLPGMGTLWWEGKVIVSILHRKEKEKSKERKSLKRYIHVYLTILFLFLLSSLFLLLSFFFFLTSRVNHIYATTEVVGALLTPPYNCY